MRFFLINLFVNSFGVPSPEYGWLSCSIPRFDNDLHLYVIAISVSTAHNVTRYDLVMR
jgi:hypothetical protein